MDVLGLSQAYDRYGGGAIYSFVGDLLTVRLGEYGPAIESMHVIAHLKSRGQKPRRTLEGLFDQFHKYLKTLPKVTFQRNQKRVEIRFQSEHFAAEDDEIGKPTAEKCGTAAEEVAAILPLVKQRIKSTDDFDVERFLADAIRLLTAKIDSLEEWQRLDQQAKDKRAVIRATKSPWELLEIDWTKYHPEARAILDDPFFWESANDLAPHGNDTGADLLADFRRWDKRHRTTSPFDFLARLLAAWDIPPIDWTITDETTVLRLNKDEPIALNVCNEAIIALAFALVKMRGTCPPDVVEIALAALTRTAILVKHSSLSGHIKASWDGAIGKIKGKLVSLSSASAKPK